MKDKENRELNTVSILSLISLLIICAIAASPLWSSKSFEEKEITLRRAEGLAYQIIEIQKAERTKLRNLASAVSPDEKAPVTGNLGIDQWGQPYHFQVLNKGHLHHVIVVSAGPDHRWETNLASLDPNRVHSKMELFKADDIGVVIDF
jgi:hypothetical protein